MHELKLRANQDHMYRVEDNIVQCLGMFVLVSSDRTNGVNTQRPGRRHR
jgi:hypothetical protein